MKTTFKRLLFIGLLLFLSSKGIAQYVLKINASNTIDSIAYLRASLFDDKNYIPKDTIKLFKSSITIKNTKSIVGGIYFIYFPKTKQKLQLILEDQDTVRLSISGNDYLQTATINTAKNNSFLNYQKLEKALSHYDSSYAVALKSGKKFNQIQKAAYFKVKTDSLVAFRTNALKRFKKQDALYIYYATLNALDRTIPSKRDYEGRAQFLNQFELNEPKLFFTPIMRQIIVEYLSYYPLESDSLQQGLDKVFSNLLCTNKAYPFVFDYFTKVFKNRDVQNNTEGYAYLINKYIKNNSCAFLDKKSQDAFIAELNQIQSQKLNDTALDLNLEDTTGNKISLHTVAKKYNYTVLIFFDPNCEHCKVELPKMDSVIKVLERDLLVRIGKYAVCNEPNIEKIVWKDFINKNKLDLQYTHVIMSGNNENLSLRKAYDAFTNPLFYLIDKDGVLIAKKMSTNTLRKILIQSFRNFKN
jgi:AhpC/TSA family